MTVTRAQKNQAQQGQGNTAQKIGKEFLRFTRAMTLSYVNYELLPVIPIQYQGLEELSMVPINLVINGILNQAFEVEDPLAYARAMGGGHAGKGSLKLASSSALAFICLFAIGYKSTSLGFKYLPKLIQADTKLSRMIANMLLFNEYRWAAMGIIGYAAYRGIDSLSLKVWDFCIPRIEEVEKNNPPLNLVQKAGSYVVRWAADCAVSEMVLYYMKGAGYLSVAGNSWFQIALLLASDLFLQSAEYLFYTPQPFNSVFPLKAGSETDLEQGGERAANKRDYFPAASQFGIFIAICLGAFALNALINAVLPACEVDDDCAFGQRMIRDGACFAAPLGIKYIIEDVAPRVISQCRSVLFQRRTEEQEPLLQEVAVSNTATV